MDGEEKDQARDEGKGTRDGGPEGPVGGEPGAVGGGVGGTGEQLNPSADHRNSFQERSEGFDASELTEEGRMLAEKLERLRNRAQATEGCEFYGILVFGKRGRGPRTVVRSFIRTQGAALQCLGQAVFEMFESYRKYAAWVKRNN